MVAHTLHSSVALHLTSRPNRDQAPENASQAEWSFVLIPDRTGPHKSQIPSLRGNVTFFCGACASPPQRRPSVFVELYGVIAAPPLGEPGH